MGWVKRMKASLSQLCPEFNTHRMVRQYVQDFYLPAHARSLQLGEQGAHGARELSAWLKRVQECWPGLGIEGVDAQLPQQPKVGDRFTVRARVRLGGLSESDVQAELALGQIGSDGELVNPVFHSMQPVGAAEGGVVEFEAHNIACQAGGRVGYTVRVLPDHLELANNFRPNLVAWAPNGKGV
jgi:starch phosphorylase